MQAAARALGLSSTSCNASTEREIDAAFAALRRDCGPARSSSAPEAFFNSRSEHSSHWRCATRCRRSTTYREFAAAGGLMSYGGSITDPYRQVGIYVGRILKGEKPADLPVQQSDASSSSSSI